MTAEQELYDQIGTKLKAAEHSQMFGKPCLKINGKAFASFFNNEMVFKLHGDDHRKALSFDGAQLFDPSGKGRAMKEWVQVPASHQKEWAKLAKAAIKYVEQNK